MIWIYIYLFIGLLLGIFSATLINKDTDDESWIELREQVGANKLNALIYLIVMLAWPFLLVKFMFKIRD